MALVSLEPSEWKRLIHRRRRSGGDRYDEVWDGVYVMAPLADNEHQSLGLDLAIAFKDALDAVEHVQVFHGCNVKSVGVRELLLIDRHPWALEWYRVESADWALVGRADLQSPGGVIASNVLGLTFQLVAGEARPQIEIIRQQPGKTWIV